MYNRNENFSICYCSEIVDNLLWISAENKKIQGNIQRKFDMWITLGDLYTEKKYGKTAFLTNYRFLNVYNSKVMHKLCTKCG